MPRASATAGSAAFFRAPARVRPDGGGLVVAPADGLVSLIMDAPPPPELGLDPTPLVRVSIFLSIFDVHIQRIPIDGDGGVQAERAREGFLQRPCTRVAACRIGIGRPLHDPGEVVGKIRPGVMQAETPIFPVRLSKVVE